MNKILNEYITVVTELKKMQQKIACNTNGKEALQWPQIISAGEGRTLEINTEIANAISRIARNYWKNEPELKRRVRLKGWSSTIRRLFGIPLSKLDLDVSDEDLALTLQQQITEAMQAAALPQSWILDLEHVFATTWLSIENFQSCELGPIMFETRAIWLDRMLLLKQIDKISHRRITKLWAGKKLKERKPSWETIAETAAIDIIGALPFVISIKTNNCSGDVAYQRAHRAAHIFLMSSALLWETPSKALSGMNLKTDLGPTRKISLSLHGYQKMSASYSRPTLPFGPHIKLDEWQALLDDRPDFFAAFTEITNFVVDPNYTSIRLPILLKAEIALRWFYEGCRADDELMATTHFASCLDTLGGGDGLRGIKKMIGRQLGWTSDTAVHTDGSSLGTFLNWIYGKGRSQFLHGSPRSTLATGRKCGHLLR